MDGTESIAGFILLEEMLPVSGQQRSGIIREQQVKFTKARPTDNPAAPLLMIELRTIPMNKEGHYQGFIEINGQNTNGVYQQATT